MDIQAMKRWQFSLASSLVATTLFAIGCALFRMSDVPSDIFPHGELTTFGAFFLGSSLGVLVGYGLNRHDGALAGGLMCGIAAFFCYDAYYVLDVMSGWD